MMVYRDPNPLDPNKNYTAEELARFIREKLYGEHTREAMAKSLLKANEVAEWAGEVAQQIIDGAFDEGELLTEIKRKLNELEEQYAPKLSQKPDIFLSATEPTDTSENAFWYEDLGEAPIDINVASILVANAHINNTEPSDTDDLWFKTGGTR